MKLEPKDYIALATAAFTVGTVIWKGGQITAQLETTNEAVKALVPVVGRLDVQSAKLEAKVEANTARLEEHARRIDRVEARK